MMLCSEVAMTNAEKESEARCKAMLNELISVVKKQTMEMEDLAERMDELAVGLKAIVKPLGAPVQALPPLVPAPTATLVAAVVHAVAAATPRAETAHAPESPTKCSTSGPDPNAGYAKVAVVSLLSRGATTACRALAEPVNVSSSKSFDTGELDTVTPTRCSTACRGCNIDVPSTCPQKVAPTPPSADAMLDAAVIALVHSTGEIAVDKDGSTDTLEHAAMGQVEAALASNGHDNLWINYNIRFPDFSSCVFAALVVPTMEVFGEMGDKNKREQYFVDMVWEQWLEPWPPPHKHGILLELFHKQAGIRSWRTTFANAEMGVLNLLVHGVILVEQLLLPYWDYEKFQSLFWVQLKSYSNTYCHGCVELMVDSSTGMYTVVLEDGQGEDLGLLQLCELLMAEENGASGMMVRYRKRKLDLLASSGSATEVKGPPSTRQRVDACEMSARPDVSQQSGYGSDVSEDAESSSNSSDSTKELPAETCPPPLVQGPELPPSSGDIAVPEESISYPFSVYNFLRSFSVQLFVNPFGLDDFVASINCTVQNTLLDAVHVSLLRALRRHLETKSSEGSELASNCLKYLDWALLDALTWPVFLLEYLYVMGCIKNLEGQSFGRSLLAIEYYKLPVTMKLKVLQILCDHVIDSEELKTELEAREGYNEEMEYEIDSSSIFSEAGLRAVLTRASKASACKKIEDLQNFETAPNVDFSPEINRLQKEILVLQTEKEFIKSSYESGIAKYWDLEKKINDMQEDVCYFQKEVPDAKSTKCNVELEPNLDAHCARPSPDVYEALHYEENASVDRFDAAKGGQRSTASVEQNFVKDGMPSHKYWDGKYISGDHSVDPVAPFCADSGDRCHHSGNDGGVNEAIDQRREEKLQNRDSNELTPRTYSIKRIEDWISQIDIDNDIIVAVQGESSNSTLTNFSEDWISQIDIDNDIIVVVQGESSNSTLTNFSERVTGVPVVWPDTKSPLGMEQEVVMMAHHLLVAADRFTNIRVEQRKHDSTPSVTKGDRRATVLVLQQEEMKIKVCALRSWSFWERLEMHYYLGHWYWRSSIDIQQQEFASTLGFKRLRAYLMWIDGVGLGTSRN